MFSKESLDSNVIAESLTAAAIEWKIDDDGDVYAKQGGIDFGVFIQLEKERSKLRLMTYYQCKEGVDEGELGKFVAALNKQYVLVKFTATSYDDGRKYLNGFYDIYYNFGLDSALFLFTLRKFAAIFLEAVREDTDDVFFE